MFTITSDSPGHTHTHECTQTHQKQFQGHESFPMQQNNFIYNDTHTSRQGRTLYHEKHSRWILQKTKSTIFQCPMYTHAHTNTEEELPLKNNCLYNNYYEEWWWSTHTHKHLIGCEQVFHRLCVHFQWRVSYSQLLTFLLAIRTPDTFILWDGTKYEPITLNTTTPCVYMEGAVLANKTVHSVHLQCPPSAHSQVKIVNDLIIMNWQ